MTERWRTAMRRWVGMVCVAGAVAWTWAPSAEAQHADAMNPAEGAFSDEWAELYLLGQKAGFIHTTMTRKGDRVHTAVSTKMRIARANVSIAIEVTQTSVETLAGEPLEMESTTVMADNPVRMKAEFKGDGVTVTSSQFGMDNTQTYQLTGADGKPVKPLMAWGAQRESLIRGFKPGTEYTLPTYAPDLRPDGVVEVITKVGNDETFEHRGKNITARRVDATLSTPMGSLPTINWVNPETGSALRSTLMMGGIQMEVYAVDQATAVSEFVPAEFFMTNTIAVPKPIPAAKANRVTYRLAPKPGTQTKLELPETGMQKVAKSESGAVTLVVTRIDRDAVAAAGPGAAPGAEFLDSNVLINTKDAQLIELANKAAGGAAKPLELADNLRRFVTEYIEQKGMDVAFATASDVCRSRKGDCSEHAVLLAALGRIKGLPSRVAVGLAYVPAFGNQKDIFGFHMWTQFYINGTWVDVDAALRETDCSPTRIAFGVSSLKESALAEMSFKLMEVIGRVDLSVENVVEKGAATK